MIKIAPTAVFSLFGGRIEIRLFGRPFDWSIAKPRAEVLKRIYEQVCATGIKKILAPNPSSFNGLICHENELRDQTVLKEAKPLALLRGDEPLALWRGCHADGVELPASCAFWMSSADCLTIVAYDLITGRTVAAHAGRDSLLDRSRINGKEARSHESVVDSIFECLGATERLKVFLTGGIAAQNFPHLYEDKKWGVANKLMVQDVLDKWGPTCLSGNLKEGRLALNEIAIAQFIRLGVKPHNIGSDLVDTFGDVDQKGDPIFWSYRRSDKLQRNGVLVLRHW